MSPTSYQLLHSAIFNSLLLYYYTPKQLFMQVFFYIFQIFPPAAVKPQTEKYNLLYSGTELSYVELYSGTHSCSDDA